MVATSDPRRTKKQKKVFFDAAFFLYLNPEVDTDLETAEAYYRTHLSETLYGDAALVPSCFNEKIYLEEHRKTADVSHLNQLVIENDHKNEDIDDTDVCCRHGDYVDNLKFRVKLVSKNKFRLSCRDELTPKLLNVFDEVKIQKSPCDVAYATVTSIDDGCITVSNRYFDFCDGKACYELCGIRVADIRRVAIINYMKNAVGACAAEFCKIDPTFNVELYKVLYPDARSLTCMGAYLDYVSHSHKGDRRIHAASDLCTSLELIINSPVMFMGHEIKSISTDHIHGGRHICDHTSLISEKAIKTYIDEKDIFEASKIDFEGSATFHQSAKFPRGMDTIAIGIGRPRISHRIPHHHIDPLCDQDASDASDHDEICNNDDHDHRELFECGRYDIPDLSRMDRDDCDDSALSEEECCGTKVFACKTLIGGREPPSSPEEDASVLVVIGTAYVKGDSYVRDTLTVGAEAIVGSIICQSNATVLGHTSMNSANIRGPFEINGSSKFTGDAEFASQVSTVALGIGNCSPSTAGASFSEDWRCDVRVQRIMNVIGPTSADNVIDFVLSALSDLYK